MKIDLYNGECLEVMDKLIEQGVKVDAVITDPPYNISRETNFKSMGTRGGNVAMQFGEWDKGADILSYIDKLPLLLNNNSNVVIFNDWKNLGDIYKTCLKNNIIMKRCLVMNKSNPAPFNRDRMFVNNVEFFLWGVYGKTGKPKKWTFNREDKLEKCVFDTTVQHSKLHPTMKDLKVIEKLVRLLTNEGDAVLDPYMGSGTTGVACKKLNRNFIGIELDKGYFKIAKERVENTKIMEKQILKENK